MMSTNRLPADQVHEMFRQALESVVPPKPIRPLPSQIESERDR